MGSNGGSKGRAACRDVDPELFFPPGTTGPALRQIREAKQVCRRCPVQVSCLQFALETGEDFGIWGGTTEDERRHAMHKRRQQQILAGAAVATTVDVGLVTPEDLPQQPDLAAEPAGSPLQYRRA